MPAKIFISHASNDEPIVRLFVENLLQLGLGIASKDIFCSSLKGNGIKPGLRFEQSIRDNLDEATCVIALISNNYYGSAFCMCELGGAWLTSKAPIPVLIPPLTYADLKAVINGIQAIRIQDSSDLDDLKDSIEERTGHKTHSTPQWNTKKAEFIDEFDEKRKSIKDATPVSRDIHTKLLEELNEYKKETSRLLGEIENLNVLQAKLAALKDKADVNNIIIENSDEIEAFDHLIHEAKSNIVTLGWATKEALFYRSRGEGYFPTGSDLDDAEKASEAGELYHKDEEGFLLKERSPKVSRAIDSIEKLKSWLIEHETGVFSDWHTDQYDELPEIGSRHFWKEHLS